METSLKKIDGLLDQIYTELGQMPKATTEDNRSIPLRLILASVAVKIKALGQSFVDALETSVTTN